MTHPRLLIFGFGRTGLATARLARQLGLESLLLDESSSAKTRQAAERLRSEGFCAQAAWDGVLPAGSFVEAVMSPGIPPSSRCHLACREAGIPVTGDTDFAARHLPPDVKLVGITGTNGKTTTTELTTHLLQAGGLRAGSYANIGTPLAEALLDAALPEVAVLELSSFQLDLATSLRLKAAVLLNISSDHIDRYSDHAAYARSKAHILAISQLAAITPQAAAELSTAGSAAQPHWHLFGAEDDLHEDHLRLGAAEPWLPLPPLQLAGHHNLQNLAAALILCRAVGLPPEKALPHASSFATGAHRQQIFLNKNGVSYVDDSKATNPDAMMVAIKRFSSTHKSNIILIAGGRDKKMDFSIVKDLLQSYVKRVHTYGECQEQLLNLWSSLVPCHRSSSFEDASLAAMQDLCEGDVVLLSPGCASLDCFSSYAERGHTFQSIVSRTQT